MVGAVILRRRPERIILAWKSLVIFALRVFGGKEICFRNDGPVGVLGFVHAVFVLEGAGARVPVFVL